MLAKRVNKIKIKQDNFHIYTNDEDLKEFLEVYIHLFVGEGGASLVGN